MCGSAEEVKGGGGGGGGGGRQGGLGSEVLYADEAGDALAAAGDGGDLREAAVAAQQVKARAHGQGAEYGGVLLIGLIKRRVLVVDDHLVGLAGAVVPQEHVGDVQLALAGLHQRPVAVGIDAQQGTMSFTR